MTYDTFISKVTDLLLYDSIEDDAQHAAFINENVRTWMSTMQYYVDNFKVRNVDSYGEADFTKECEGGTLLLPSTLEKLVRVEFIKPDNFPLTIIVAGAGVAAANGTYTRESGGSAENPPVYTNGSYSIRLLAGKWTIFLDGQYPLYESSDDVVSPDLVTTWVELLPDAMIVGGAGTNEVDGVYVRNGDYVGTPRYSGLSIGQEITEADSGNWGIWFEGWDGTFEASYLSAEDIPAAPTPNTVITWNVGSNGIAPAPTVNYATWIEVAAEEIDGASVPTLINTVDPVLPTVTKGNSCDNAIPMKPTDYDQRDELLRKACCTDNCYKYAIDKRATEITVYPLPDAEYSYGPEFIRITWEGVKNDYAGSDEVPFPLDTIKNCSEYVNAFLARKKEDKLALYNSFYQSYLEGRREIAQAQRMKSWQRP